MRKKIYSHKNRMVLLFCLLAFAGIGQTKAQCTVDNYAQSSDGYDASLNVYIGQSFKAPCNELLSTITVYSNYDYFHGQRSTHLVGSVDIYAGDGPTGTLLITQTFDVYKGPYNDINIVFPIPFSLTGGNTYTFMVTTNQAHSIDYNEYSNYTDGIYYSLNHGNSSSEPDLDLKFALDFTPPCTPTTSTTDSAICPSALPFSWNGLTFNGAGSKTKTGLTNAGGCDSSATLNLTVNSTPDPLSLSATPSSICLGQSSVLSAFLSGFKGDFAPSKWILTQNSNGGSNGAGGLDTTYTPNYIILIKSEEGGTIDYVYKNMPASGPLTFQWYKSAYNAPAIFEIFYFNSGTWNLIPNSGTANFHGEAFTVNVTKGEDFGFRVKKPSFSGIGPIAIVSFEILAAPAPAAVSWFTTSTGGTAFSTDASTSVTPATLGINYYAEISDAITGCTSLTRGVVAVNAKTPVGITSITAGNNPICSGTQTTLTANGVTGTNALVTWYDHQGHVLGTGLTSPLVGAGTYYAVVSGDCGTEAQLSITINSGDVTNPTITCPANVNANNNVGCTKALVLTAPIYSDNCAVKALSWVLTGATNAASATTGIRTIAGRTFNNGTTNITYTVTDSSNNFSTCSFTVTVKDIVKPTFTSTQPSIVLNGCAQNVAIPAVSFTDNCGTPTLTNTISGASNRSSTPGQVGTVMFANGVSTVKYTLTDAAGNVNTSSFTVTILDNTAPSISCPADITTSTVGTSCTKNIAIPAALYSDNCGVKSLTWSMTGATVLSSPINGVWTANTKTFKAGLTTLTYTIKDGTGNTTICSTRVQLNTNNVCPPVTPFSRSIVANEETATELKAVLSPNPTTSTFALRVKSNSNTAVEITVYNSEGKRVQQLKTANLNNIVMGEKYQTGSYMFEVRQGEKRTTVIGVKQ